MQATGLLKHGLSYVVYGPRVEIAFAAGLLLDPARSLPASHPDGSSFAVTADGPEGCNGLWLSRTSARYLARNAKIAPEIAKALRTQLEMD